MKTNQNQNNNSMDAEIKKMNEGIISGNQKDREEAASKLHKAFVSDWSEGGKAMLLLQRIGIN